MAQKTYKLEPLKVWQKSKELRFDYYKKYLEAKEKGGIRYAGGAMAFHALTQGLGRDVYNLTGEPYGATSAYDEAFAVDALEACDRAGIARDLCSYMRNYWGSMLLNKFVHTDGTVLPGWPRPDFYFTLHLCCCHAKWYQYAGEIDGNAPEYAVETGLFEIAHPKPEQFQRAVDYVSIQLNEAIPWMEKVTGRKFDDELFYEAVDNEIASRALWSQTCALNKAVPAPMEEKTMLSFYVFDTLNPHWKTTVDFFKELKDEIQDRVDRGIGAVYPEKFRFITDSQPPWAFLDVFRFLTREFGAVSVGSLYIFVFGSWIIEEDGSLTPAKTLKQQGIDLSSKSREDVIRIYAEQVLRGFAAPAILQVSDKGKIMEQMCKQWKAQAVLMHLNRGCEGMAVGQMQSKIELAKAGIPAFTYEGNMADPRDFDLARTKSRIEDFMESVGAQRVGSA